MFCANHQSVCASGLSASRCFSTKHLALTAPRRGTPHHSLSLRSQRRRVNHVRSVSEDKSSDGQTSTAVETGEAPEREAVATPSSANDAEQPEVSKATSEEDIRTLKAALQQQRADGAQDIGLVEGLLEEVRLISWPNPLQALSDTFVVIAIVAGTAVTLFAVNTVLAEISKQIY